MNKMFLAYLLSVIGIMMLLSGPPSANSKRYVLEPELDQKIYQSREAFEKDREAFVKTICDPQFDGSALGKRGWECA